MARAWAEVLVRPQVFFRYNVAPGDQGPGVTFLAALVFLEEAIRIALVADAYPVFGGRPTLSAFVWLLVAAVLLAPLGTHLVAALQTILLAAAAPDRGGVSETVQVICYAAAPCLLAGIPNPELRTLLALYGASVYVAGLSIVHDVDELRALVLGALPAGLIFGVGFRGFAAAETVLARALEAAPSLL
jgi:hypothetical protein